MKAAKDFTKSPASTRTYLSLGSNLGDRSENLRAGIDRLRQCGKIIAISPFYETEPMELRDQPWFVNCVIALDTELSATELLARIQEIEAELGRKRQVSKGPRTLDIDILLFGDQVIDGKDLRIPHPAMEERRFVLEPLVEIAPNVRHPVSGKSVQKLLEDLGRDAGQVIRLSK